MRLTYISGEDSVSRNPRWLCGRLLRFAMVSLINQTLTPRRPRASQLSGWCRRGQATVHMVIRYTVLCRCAWKRRDVGLTSDWFGGVWVAWKQWKPVAGVGLLAGVPAPRAPYVTNGRAGSGSELQPSSIANSRRVTCRRTHPASHAARDPPSHPAD